MNRIGISSRRNGAPAAHRRARREGSELFAGVRALVLDIDGVLTDGSEYWGRWGERLKRFNTLDAKGIEHLRKAGVKVFVISGEHSPISRRYVKRHPLDGAAVGVEDKCEPLRRFVKEHRLPLAAVAYVGDDDVDLPCMALVGVPVAVPNAVAEVRAAARYVTRTRGRRGAVREVADLILLARGVPARGPACR